MIDSLTEFLDRTPFQPFRIVTTSGDRYEVRDPHLVALGRSQLFYCYPRTDRLAHIRLNQIVALETLQEAA